MPVTGDLFLASAKNKLRVACILPATDFQYPAFEPGLPECPGKERIKVPRVSEGMIISVKHFLVKPRLFWIRNQNKPYPF